MYEERRALHRNIFKGLFLLAMVFYQIFAHKYVYFFQGLLFCLRMASLLNYPSSRKPHFDKMQSLRKYNWLDVEEARLLAQVQGSSKTNIGCKLSGNIEGVANTAKLRNI